MGGGGGGKEGVREGEGERRILKITGNGKMK